MSFGIFKKRNICESPVHQKASTKISSESDWKQRSYSIFSNEVKTAKFSEIFVSRNPNFQLFQLFKMILKVHDERNRTALVSSKSVVKCSRYLVGAEAPPPHQLT